MRIKELREKVGLSQYELADRMQVAQPSVVKWESGLSYPTSDKLPKLASILGCSISDLFQNHTTGKEELPCQSVAQVSIKPPEMPPV